MAAAMSWSERRLGFEPRWSLMGCTSLRNSDYALRALVALVFYFGKFNIYIYL